MTSKKTQNNILSEKTFELISQWFHNYYSDPEAIGKSDEYNIFEQYVENPFLEFCDQVARILPPHFGIYWMRKDKTYTKQSDDYRDLRKN